VGNVIEQFAPSVSESELANLRLRLQDTRWPEQATDLKQGIALERVRDLCAYWSESYDWHRCADRLNAIGQHRTTIDGLGIHFLHARSGRPDAVPLILTHGWPGSVIEYVDVIPLLTEAGFDCVVPSMPGYGFSDKPHETGWGIARIARAWAELMSRLGYARYGAIGGDWGTSISTSLAQQDASHVAGLLLVPPLAPPLPGERRKLDRSEDGYSTQQGTRPQTIGYSLVDSPAGLAAWITEKVDGWSDPRSEISLDSVIDNLMLYWLPGTGASAARLYWESLRDIGRWLRGPLNEDDLIRTPVGGVVFPYEIQKVTREEAEQRFTDIRYWSEPAIGGHFAAWEQPGVFADEVKNFFGRLR
jgi:pimeloyl-ACP methyl ester carboxylesterase